jgi:hypothetical protein
MSDFVFSIATAADDEDIRKLLRDNPMPGEITISYERSPSYFHGCGVMGDFHQTMILRHKPSGLLAGLGCRAVRSMFINGRATNVGYLGQLRADHRFQGRGLVTLAFRHFRKLDEDQRADGYITTLIEGNRAAEAVLVRRRSASLPHYRQIDRLYTLAIPARSFKAHSPGAIEIGAASNADLKDIIRFLHRYGSEKQFFPVLQEDDFLSDSPCTRDFRIEDFLVARQAGNICGVTGLWDQSAYKQPVVRGYSGKLSWGRHLFNAYARCRGYNPLPPPGEPISLVYAAFTCIADNSLEVYYRLLHNLCALAAERGYGRVLTGHTERDPLLAVARRFPHIPYTSHLYTACWKEKSQFHDNLDRRISHVEIATI